MSSSSDRRSAHQTNPIRVPKMAELVADDLRRKIIRGQLSPADALPAEPALLEMYNVSRPTLRESLRILESEGLISVKRGVQGGRVHLPDIGVASRHMALQLQIRGTTIEDLFRARCIIEPAAVRMLAERPTRAAIKALRKQQDQERDLLADPDAFAWAATVFHELLVQLAGNKTLALMSEIMVDIVDRHHHVTFATAISLERGDTEEACDHHHHVIDLIEAGQADEAETFWRKHIDGGAERALRHLGPKTIVDLLG